MSRLAGKVALVTGASRGIGRGIALCLAEEGADVMISYRSHADEARAVQKSIAGLGRRAMVWQADVADRTAVKELVQATVAHFGGLDILVANAAMTIREPVVDASWENVRQVVEVSQFGVFHACQLAAREMVGQGRGGKIILIGSILEEFPAPGSAAYNMSKAAINHLGRSMASELAAHHINVNMINPGWIDTPGERAFASEDELQAGGKRIPWGRLGTPRDIGKAAVFLASADADYVTGATLRVDGGMLLGLRLPPSEEC